MYTHTTQQTALAALACTLVIGCYDGSAEGIHQVIFELDGD